MNLLVEKFNKKVPEFVEKAIKKKTERKIAEAVVYYRQSIRYFRKEFKNELEWAPAIFLEFGELLMVSGEYEESINYLKVAAEMFCGSKGDQSLEYAHSLSLLAEACLKSNIVDKALDFFNLSKKIFDINGNEKFILQIVKSMISISDCYSMQSNPKEALNVLLSAEEKLVQLANEKNYLGYGKCLEAQSEIYVQLGKYTNSLDCLSRALGLYFKGGNKDKALGIRELMGDLYMRRGNIDSAIKFYDDVFASVQDNQKIAARVLYKLSTCDFLIGEYEAARHEAQEGIELLGENPERELDHQALHELYYIKGRAGIELSDFEQGVEDLTRSLEHSTNNDKAARVIIALGNQFKIRGEYDKAWDMYYKVEDLDKVKYKKMIKAHLESLEFKKNMAKEIEDLSAHYSSKEVSFNNFYNLEPQSISFNDLVSNDTSSFFHCIAFALFRKSYIQEKQGDKVSDDIKTLVYDLIRTSVEILDFEKDLNGLSPSEYIEKALNTRNDVIGRAELKVVSYFFDVQIWIYKLNDGQIEYEVFQNQTQKDRKVILAIRKYKNISDFSVLEAKNLQNEGMSLFRANDTSLSFNDSITSFLRTWS